MDEEEDDITQESEPVSYQWRQSHQMADALWLAASISRANTEFLEAVAHRAAAHHNYLVDRDSFAEAAAVELETIIQTEE